MTKIKEAANILGLPYETVYLFYQLINSIRRFESANSYSKTTENGFTLIDQEKYIDALIQEYERWF